MARQRTGAGHGAGTDLDREQRDARIWSLHVAGHSAREIGAIVGLGHVRVMEIVHHYKGDSPVWSGEQVRQVEDDRLRRLLLALSEGIEGGEVPAISEARKISESRRKLYGADGPITVNHNHADVSAIDAAYLDLVAEMDAANAAREAALRDIRGV